MTTLAKTSIVWTIVTLPFVAVFSLCALAMIGVLVLSSEAREKFFSEDRHKS